MLETKILLEEKELPPHWYNIAADLPEPLQPPLNPATREPISPEDLTPIFPRGLIEQEVSQEGWVQVPREVLEVLRLWRPTPLYRAHRLEEQLRTPARIYYKYEGVSPAGSHKPNTAVPQAYYNKVEGVRRLATETGAGQWGSAISFACHLFGLECQVYMVRVSYRCCHLLLEFLAPKNPLKIGLWGWAKFQIIFWRSISAETLPADDDGDMGGPGDP